MLPKISVIVCSYNGAARIKETLESLKNQSYPNLEVIVVDDGSTDRTSDVARQYDFKLIRLEKNLGLAAARNRGVKEAAGEIIAFTDDDCIAHKDWIKNLAEVYSASEVDGVGGRIEAYSTSSLLEKYAYFARHPIYAHRPQIESGHRVINYLKNFFGLGGAKLIDGQRIAGMMGANSSFRRSLLERAGGRDERFKNYGEDWDLNVRLSKLGANLVYRDGAVIYHKHRIDLKSFVRHMFKYGEVYYTIHKKHREVQFLLYPVPVLVILLFAAGLITGSLNFLLAFLIAYYLLSLIHPIKTFHKHRSILLVLLMPVIDLIKEFSYFLGSVAGVVAYRMKEPS